MSQRDPLVALRDMRNYGREAVDLVARIQRADLESDRVLSLAVVRLLEVVGEAARSVPDDIRQRYPEVPWGEVVGMRNLLIHAYHRIDLGTVWDVLTRDLPRLVDRLDEIVRIES